MSKPLILTILLFNAILAFAQDNDFRSAYDSFKNQAKQDYNDFRDKANREYADFIRQAWLSYKTLPAVPKPKEKEVPPVIIREEDKKKPIDDRLVVIEEEINIPTPQPQPVPVAPIREQPHPVEQSFAFSLYGTEMRVRLDDALKFRLPNLELESIAKVWEQLSGDKYNNVIRDCLQLRIRRQLCDWSYLRMLDALCSGFLGENSNEAELLKAYIYCQSGYQMRLAVAYNRLYMLYASQHFIFDKACWQVDGIFYYADNCNADKIQLCEAAFPHEQALSLYIPQEQSLSREVAPKRVLQSSDVEWLKATVAEDENLMAFCKDYPTSCIGEDFMTRWAMYANTPMSSGAKSELYPALKQFIKGRPLAEAVDILCHWVQTAFVYEYDDKVWGADRAFFADETLYYPYCDCEDRSILLTRIVRDLLGLKCALVYYPGHLATAIAIGDEVKGDHILINNTKYIVCDPTYIGAPIGMTMPDMDNKSAKVIIL
ncbi:hypothetical protein AB9N12_01380 [Bacteroides sp. AN502(2024)]|uniref:hypothetical protein n=1 Tax=Bacteroides sp. AN502(2024) TaxID=3160599 RepID=UPI003519AADB